MNSERIKLEDDGRGFVLYWEGGSLFTVYKQNGQKLGEWNEDHVLSPGEAEQVLLRKRESGEYLNIIE
ncbi:MAG TPA: hypothetical protein PK878_07180 [bacterium]|nr:hypothetical protein [Candidatus Omnitrophota bacterium]HOJ60055.1 hypothetical protein [bacterium]HOL96393.1 hypothetical protein [bacterium]HPP00543.1 hypothetical protein [bacterium]HXK92101.1 hypothetical protein [bacterium]